MKTIYKGSLFKDVLAGVEAAEMWLYNQATKSKVQLNPKEDAGSDGVGISLTNAQTGDMAVGVYALEAYDSTGAVVQYTERYARVIETAKSN